MSSHSKKSPEKAPSGTSGSKYTGRLSEDEARRLCLAIGVQSEKTGPNKRHRNSGTGSGQVTALAFLRRFPPVVKPFLAALLKELRREKDSPTLTREDIIHLGGVFLYPRPQEIEQLLLKGLVSVSAGLKTSSASPSREKDLVHQLLVFSYLITLFLQYPKSPLFRGLGRSPGERNNSDADNNDPDLEIKGFPQFNPTDNSIGGPDKRGDLEKYTGINSTFAVHAGYCATCATLCLPVKSSHLERRNKSFSTEDNYRKSVPIQRLSSQDILDAFAHAKAPHPEDITFPALEASFAKFVETQPVSIEREPEKFVEAVCAWTNAALPFLGQTLGLGMKSLLSGAYNFDLSFRPASGASTAPSRRGGGPANAVGTAGELHPPMLVFLGDANDVPANDTAGNGVLTHAGSKQESPLTRDEELSGADGLPKHSKSMLYVQSDTEGWRGFFLASSSRCIQNEELCFVLRQNMSQFNTRRWVLLFATWLHGRSFNRLLAKILNYPPPSILIIKSENNDCFGVVAGSPWKDHNGRFFGSSDTFLWTLSPHFEKFSAGGVGKNFIFVNQKNAFHEKGMGFGGQPGCFRLWLDDDFSNCYATTSDSTYAPGALLPSSVPNPGQVPAIKTESAFQTVFKVAEIEVWGAAGADALRQQLMHLERDENIRLERRQVDRTRFADNAFDREMLLGNTGFVAHKDR